jgi:hypothetical protein
MVSPVSANAALQACKCGATTGTITADSVICIGCATKRVNLSATAKAFLTGITSNFGEPNDAVIFRRPSAIEQINKQDAFLKRKRTPSGESWFDIITRCLDENFLGEVTEPEIATDPIGTEPEQSLSTGAEDVLQNEHGN